MKKMTTVRSSICVSPLLSSPLLSSLSFPLSLSVGVSLPSLIEFLYPCLSLSLSLFASLLFSSLLFSSLTSALPLSFSPLPPPPLTSARYES
jgi:hypothetical protein